MARSTNVGRILGLRKIMDAASVGALDDNQKARNKSLTDNSKKRGENLRKYLFNNSDLSIVSSTPKVFAGIVEQDFG